MRLTASIRKRPVASSGIKVAFAVAAVLAIGGCVPASELRAQERVRSEVDEMVDRAREDVLRFDEGDFPAFIRDGGLRVGRSFVGMSDDEIAMQLIEGGDGGVTVLLDASATADVGSLTFVSLGSGESGGGMSYDQSHLYLCWSIEVDLDALTVSDPENAECSPGVVRYVGGADLVTI